MGKRIVQVFYGPGKGKTSAAVGQCIRAASLGQSVIIIQFLKGKDAEEFNFLERLEPDIKLFRFEKSEESYDSLLPSQKKEEQQNIINYIMRDAQNRATSEAILEYVKEHVQINEKDSGKFIPDESDIWAGY